MAAARFRTRNLLVVLQHTVDAAAAILSYMLIAWLVKLALPPGFRTFVELVEHFVLFVFFLLFLIQVLRHFWQDLLNHGSED